MMISLLRILVLYCALTDMALVADRAGQMQNLHQQLAKAARELSEPAHMSHSRSQLEASSEARA
jgi:hypothetical protein